LTRNYLCAVNPLAGSGKAFAMYNRLKKDLSEDIFIEVISDKPGDFSRKITSENLQNVDAVLVFGGDGTMHDVVNALHLQESFAIPVLLFPAGSGNAFNHDLFCHDYVTALNNLRSFNVKEVDLMEISYANNICISFNMIGWGLVSKINKVSEKLRWIGNARYTLSSLIVLLSNPIEEIKLKLTNIQEQIACSFILIMNTKHTGKGMKMAPLAELNDGLMDVLIVRKTSVLNLLFLFPKVYSGKHIHSKRLQYVHADFLEMESNPSSLTIDGEVKGEAPFRVRMSEKKLRVIC
jgi:YegS/Rv2252/BmrU family lipid kinase